MKLRAYIVERDYIRVRWHEVRTERLELKNELIKENKSISDIRHNHEYKRLKKEQKHISRMIKHIENKIVKGRKNEA